MEFVILKCASLHNVDPYFLKNSSYLALLGDNPLSLFLNPLPNSEQIYSFHEIFFYEYYANG